jgi:rubrerythrin
MDADFRDWLVAEAERGGRAYIRNLAAAEAAVLRGQFNAAKVLRALAHTQRALAMDAARLLARDSDPADAFGTVLADLDAGSGADHLTARHPAAERVAAVRARARDIAGRAQTSMAGQSDVKEWDVAQSVWGCYGCGYLAEGDRPDACPICGALAPEFEWFGPFYASTPEHLGQRDPAEIIATLEAIPGEVEAVLVGLDDTRLAHKPSPEEWSIKEIVGHMLETDLLFVRRARALLHEQGVPDLDTPIPPWKLQEGKGYEALPVPELLARLADARSSSLDLVRGLRPADWARRGTVRGASTSLLDLGTWLANHDRGHLAQIRQLAGR